MNLLIFIPLLVTIIGTVIGSRTLPTVTIYGIPRNIT